MSLAMAKAGHGRAAEAERSYLKSAVMMVHFLRMHLRWRVVADEWMVRYGRGIGIGRGIISVSDRLVRKKERRVPAG